MGKTGQGIRRLLKFSGLSMRFLGMLRYTLGTMFCCVESCDIWQLFHSVLNIAASIVQSYIMSYSGTLKCSYFMVFEKKSVQLIFDLCI